jgi:preprotein translocase subunit SecG
MTYVLVLIHIIVSVILILVVLLQTGKRADLAGAFGGGGSQTVFGARGAATFLSKATTISAVIFMFTSLTLSLMSSPTGSRVKSVLPQEAPAQTAPAQPGPSKSAPAPAAPASNVPATPAPPK